MKFEWVIYFDDGWKLNIFLSLDQQRIQLSNAHVQMVSPFIMNYIFVSITMWKSMNNKFYFQIHLFHCWKQDFQFRHSSSLWKYLGIFGSLSRRCSTNNNCMIRRTIVDSSKMKMNTWERPVWHWSSTSVRINSTKALLKRSNVIQSSIDSIANYFW